MPSFKPKSTLVINLSPELYARLDWLLARARLSGDARTRSAWVRDAIVLALRAEEPTMAQLFPQLPAEPPRATTLELHEAMRDARDDAAARADDRIALDSDDGVGL